jgi:23S rRNA (uracil1939-C5)-methyltransferase
VARIAGKAYFIDGALPGEEVEIQVTEERRRYARGRVTGILVASPSRRPTDAHSSRCGGTPWAHLALEASRSAKRELFLETLFRHGGVPPEAFGDLPIFASPLEYRLRNQFHVEAGPGGIRVGFFEKRSHRVVPLDQCEIVSAPAREKISRIAGEFLPPAPGRGLTLETVETIEVDGSHQMAFRRRGEGKDEPGAAKSASVEIKVGSTSYRVSPASFFQVNRHRLAPFFEEVRDLASRTAGRTALDACAGVGFLSSALLAAGYTVTAVESSACAVADGEITRIREGWVDRLQFVRRRLDEFLSTDTRSFDLAVADPPRGGLGDSAVALASRCRAALIAISCEPLSLAMDLKRILPLGFEIRSAFLEDFFPLTPRVEAVVELVRR